MWIIDLILATLLILFLIAMLVLVVICIAVFVKTIMEDFEDDDKNFWNKS